MLTLQSIKTSHGPLVSSALQIILGLRVVLRLIRSRGGTRIEAATGSWSKRVSVIVPVLNETARIKSCLDGLMAQSDAVTEILVVDGGSNDGTQSIVEHYGSRDRRVRLIDASPVPSDRTGKACGLYVGSQTPINGQIGFSVPMRMYAVRPCLCLPCWLMPNEPAFQLFSRDEPAPFRFGGCSAPS